MLTAAGMQAQLGTYKRLALVPRQPACWSARHRQPACRGGAGCGPRRHALLIIRIRTAYLRGLYESLNRAWAASRTLMWRAATSSAPSRQPAADPCAGRRGVSEVSSQIRLVDASVPRALQAMKGQIDNRYWQEWVNTLIQCQGDRRCATRCRASWERLSYAPHPHGSGYLAAKANRRLRGDVFLLLGSIPVMAFMMPDWYEMLT